MPSSHTLSLSLKGKDHVLEQRGLRKHVRITAMRSSDVNGPTAWMKHLKEHGPNKADGPVSALANISGPAT